MGGFLGGFNKNFFNNVVDDDWGGFFVDFKFKGLGFGFRFSGGGGGGF